MDFHIVEPLPVPRPTTESELRRRVIELAARLACPDSRFANWGRAVGVEYGPLGTDQRSAKIHELDAVVAHLYGLSEEQLVHIFETFHEGWDYGERLRATIEHFRRWKTVLSAKSR